MTEIAHEAPEHFEAIRQLTFKAFSASEFGHNGEGDLIDSIREQCYDMISLVAIDGKCVVGHILFSPATIRCPSSTLHGMGLGPMAVLPSHQSCGIGSALVREGLRRVAQSQAAFTLVAGHPNYYPRFGFVPAQRYSVTHGFVGMPQEILFIRFTDEDMAPQLSEGLAYYHPAFGPQHGG